MEIKIRQFVWLRANTINAHLEADRGRPASTLTARKNSERLTAEGRTEHGNEPFDDHWVLGALVNLVPRSVVRRCGWVFKSPEVLYPLQALDALLGCEGFGHQADTLEANDPKEDCGDEATSEPVTFPLLVEDHYLGTGIPVLLECFGDIVDRHVVTDHENHRIGGAVAILD